MSIYLWISSSHGLIREEKIEDEKKTSSRVKEDSKSKRNKVGI